MEAESPDNTGSELSPLTTIRVETALSRWPVHRLARKGSIDINIQEGARAGESMTWEVDYSKKHGQPGPLAYKLDTLIINRRIEEARRPVPRLLKLGSLSDICRELNLADSGKNRADIKNSLFQNAFAGITAKTRYRESDGTERTLEAAFTRYSVIFTGEKLPDGRRADGVYIVLNDVFIRVINGAMTRPLDYEYLKSLPPAPQRFYELLSYQMYAALKYDHARAKLVYSEFCAHAPQTRHTEWEKVRSQMTKIHKHHKDSGYIAQVNFDQVTASDGKPDWIMLYQPGPKAHAEFRAFTKRGGPTVLEIEPSQPLLDAGGNAMNDLERELVRRGVNEATALELVRQHSEEKIRAQIERVDWLIVKKPNKVEDPAAYLVCAIKEDYAPPPRFVSQAEHQRRQEAKQARERQESEERRRKQREDVAERTRNAQIASYRTSRTAEQLAQLEAEAIAQASEDTRKSLDSEAMQPFRKTQITLLINDHIARLLQSGQIMVDPA
jgi:hypothetical protein